MRIAQIAPLYESVPPKFYGGTERIVSYLTEELVRQNQVTILLKRQTTISPFSAESVQRNVSIGRSRLQGKRAAS